MKSASVHTPAPWRVGREIGVPQLMPHVEILCDKTFVDGMPPTTYHLAEVGYPTSMPGTVGAAERMANARLIAAAPQLLEALKEVTELLDWACGIDLLPPDADGPAAKARAAIAAAQGQTP
jgi:hypothetical protein